MICLETNIASVSVIAFTQLLTFLKNLNASYVWSMISPFIKSWRSLSLSCSHPLVYLVSL